MLSLSHTLQYSHQWFGLLTQNCGRGGGAGRERGAGAEDWRLRARRGPCLLEPVAAPAPLSWRVPVAVRGPGGVQQGGPAAGAVARECGVGLQGLAAASWSRTE